MKIEEIPRKTSSVPAGNLKNRTWRQLTNMKITEWNWKSFDGLDMYARSWTPEGKARAVIILVIGLGEHVGRYEHVGAALAAQGYALLGFDLRGHGKSGGPRGHSPSADAFMQDIDFMLKEVDTRYNGTPRILYGHSLGGLQVLRYILGHQSALKGAIVTGPALRSELETQKFKVLLAKVLGTVLPSVTLQSGLDTSMLSHTPEVVNRYIHDPLVHDRISFAMGKGSLMMIKKVFENAGTLNMPLLLMHGGADRIAYSSGSQEFAEKAGDKVTLKIWDGLYHEIHNEPEHRQVFAYMIDWLGNQGL